MKNIKQKRERIQHVEQGAVAVRSVWTFVELRRDEEMTVFRVIASSDDLHDFAAHVSRLLCFDGSFLWILGAFIFTELLYKQLHPKANQFWWFDDEEHSRRVNVYDIEQLNSTWHIATVKWFTRWTFRVSNFSFVIKRNKLCLVERFTLSVEMDNIPLLPDHAQEPHTKYQSTLLKSRLRHLSKQTGYVTDLSVNGSREKNVNRSEKRKVFRRQIFDDTRRRRQTKNDNE